MQKKIKKKNCSEPDKCVYSNNDIGFGSSLEFSLTDGSMGKSVTIFGVDMIIKEDILILGKGPRQGLDNTTLTAEAENSINDTESEKIFILRLHYNGSSSSLFVNATKISRRFRNKTISIMFR